MLDNVSRLMDKSFSFSSINSAYGMILATNHSPAGLLNVAFGGRVVLKALGDLEVGGTFNKNLKTKSFILV